MKKITFVLSILIATIIMSSRPLNAQVNDRPENIYVVEEVYFFDDLDYAFYQTYNAFLSGHDAWAGARLRKAAHLVNLEATYAKPTNRKPIEKQAERLEALADSVALGKIMFASRLRHAFSRTHHILAKDYKLRAAAAWSGQKAKETGHAMTAAAGHLAHAARWTGQKIERGVVNTGKAVGQGTETAAVGSYRGIRWLAGKMIQGVAFVPEKVGEGLEWLGKGLDKVGTKVEPSDKKKSKKK